MDLDKQRQKRQLNILKTKRSGDTIVSFLVQKPTGEITVEKGTAENILLYEHGMYQLFNEGEVTQLYDSPRIEIKPSTADSSYTLSVNDETVITSPKYADEVMEGVKDIVEYDNYNNLLDVWEEIIESQADRTVMSLLYPTVPLLDGERSRISQTPTGWLIDGYYLVDWAAEVYIVEDEGESMVVGGGGVVEADKSHEFLEMRGGDNIDDFERTTISDGSTDYVVGKKEIRFLSKVNWLLNRFDMLRDKPFWQWMERRRKAYLNGTLDEEFMF